LVRAGTFYESLATEKRDFIEFLLTAAGLDELDLTRQRSVLRDVDFGE